MTNINILGRYPFIPNGIIATDTLLFLDVTGRISRTDGTVDGTFELVDVDDFSNGVLFGIAGAGENLFFVASEDEFGREPWISDGTIEGTKILKDINPNGSSNPSGSVPLNDFFLFAANDGVNGRALWRSDGTEAGTELVRTFADIGQSSVFSFLTVGDTVYFTDGSGSVSNPNTRLWITDGTDEGTQLVSSGLSITDFIGVGDTLFFVNAGLEDTELWISDGTEAGTQLVKDIFPRPGDGFPNPSSFPRNLTDVNGTLFFTADDGVHGRELWKSDGTEAGTQLVKDIRPEERVDGIAVNNGSEPENLTDVNGTLFFTADDEVHGRELWKSDGTAEGTQLVEDIIRTDESNASSDLVARQFVNVDGTLYFIAQGGLWQSDGTEAGTLIVDTRLDAFPDNQQTGFLSPSITAEFNDQLFIFGGNLLPGDEDLTQAFALASLSDNENPVEAENSIGSTVYRFFNPNAGVHFYTATPEERDAVQNLDNYEFEGESYRTVDPLTGGAEEVYRFFNSQTGVHLYTTSEDERDNIQANLEQFTFEGTSFYAYETQIEGSIPVYRYFEPTIGVHFYTPNEAESTFVEENLDNYISEGIAYYAFPLAGDV